MADLYNIKRKPNFQEKKNLEARMKQIIAL